MRVDHVRLQLAQDRVQRTRDAGIGRRRQEAVGGIGVEPAQRGRPAVDPPDGDPVLVLDRGLARLGEGDHRDAVASSPELLAERLHVTLEAARHGAVEVGEEQDAARHQAPVGLDEQPDGSVFRFSSQTIRDCVQAVVPALHSRPMRRRCRQPPAGIVPETSPDQLRPGASVTDEAFHAAPASVGTTR